MATKHVNLPDLFARSQPLTKKRAAGVYGIIHSGSGRIYIGATRHLMGRRGVHRHDLRTKTHCCKELEFDVWSDSSAFDFVVIEYVKDEQKLLQREQFWLQFYQSWHPEHGYNASPSADRKGYKQSPEHIERMAVTKRGVKLPPFSKEHREKLRISNIGNENLSQVRPVFGISVSGEKTLFKSVSFAARSASGGRAASGNIIAAIQRGGTAFGFRWEYANA